MPVVQAESIFTFTSEDPIHPASNLLNSDPAKKWKCAQFGTKNASIVLQLRKAVQLTGIDVGNEYSAFIEVLVSRADEDFKPLISMTSFMSPFESRQGQNPNKVKMFTATDFAQPEGNEKWDKIKFLCFQPYNNHVQFGLSFVTLHSNVVATETDKKNVGKFTLRPDSPLGFTIGNLFKREKENVKESPVTGAAAIRESSNNPSAKIYKAPVVKNLPKKPVDIHLNDEGTQLSRERYRNELLYTEDDNNPNEKIDKLIAKKMQETKAKVSTPTVTTNSPKTKKISLSPTVKKPSNTVGSPGPSQKKRQASDESIASPNKKQKIEVKRKMKPYEKLLEGVVIVISGIQNPERALLRTCALAMGAKYKADWDQTCTHLICAFTNTPKFNQVRGKGKIVKREWINSCSRQRKRLPWRRFALDSRDQNGNESEEEIWEEVITQDSVEEQTNDEETIDTDDEIQRVQQNNGDHEMVVNENSIPIDKEAEKQTNEITTNGIPKLQNFFSGKTFYVDNSLGDMKQEIERHIVAYDGKVLKKITDLHDGNIGVVSKDSYEETKILQGYTTQIVMPEWIIECHNKQCLLPFYDYSF